MVKWTGHVTGMRGGQMCWENLKGRDHLEDLEVDDKHQNGCQDTGLGAKE
jgi:hypothetical protein